MGFDLQPGNKEVCCCSGSKKQTHREILHVRTREHISCEERPPGDVCNGRGHPWSTVPCLSSLLLSRVPKINDAQTVQC
eukprot:1161998-Pelagomonas_calceolata.AAC.4